MAFLGLAVCFVIVANSCNPRYFRMRPFGCGPAWSGVLASILSGYMGRIMMRSMLREATLVALRSSIRVTSISARFARRASPDSCVGAATSCVSVVGHLRGTGSSCCTFNGRPGCSVGRGACCTSRPRREFTLPFRRAHRLTTSLSTSTPTQAWMSRLTSRSSFRRWSFDAVLCSHVLERVPEDVNAAREMARVLPREGVALIQVPVDPT